MIDSTLLRDLTPLLVAFSAVFGLVIGSFLNVVIYRLPAGLSVVNPPSACPKCSTPIKGRDNVPVLSWLLLRGKCRSCAAPISARYPSVELATSILFAVVTCWSLTTHPALAPVLLYLSAAGVALFMIDLDTMRLPDKIVLPSYPVVGLGLVVAGLLSGEWPLVQVALSTLLWALVFGIPWFVTAGRGMGFGDVKLAPLLGAVLGAVGWGSSLVGLMSGFAIGALVGVGLILFSEAGRKTRVPFGPFMLAGALIGLLGGEFAFHAYLSLMGLA